MTIPDDVARLIEHFRASQRTVKAPTYKETELRSNFLDPFFKALGWDVYNERHEPEDRKEVVREERIQVWDAGLESGSGAQAANYSNRAPDYSFRAGDRLRFFVEAKKPSVNLLTDPSPAFQVRRYGWSAKLPLSVLSDFEEFVVYDCRAEPMKTDPATLGRLLYIRYDQYAERWDEIAGLFTRDRVLDGALDQLVETQKPQKGTLTVDAAFLREISTWRDLLAADIARRNPQLSQRDLNYAVQMTIDRIIFLRICEERGIQRDDPLDALLTAPAVYAGLLERFKLADRRYNSGLFHFAQEKGRADDRDTLTPGLAIGNEPLRRIISRLYYPDSPYAFRVIPIEILGQVYEQFLGKVIRLEPGHVAVVEEKPEVRKAGGVYYTPTYIVDYIVRHTVGPLLEGKTPREVADLRILDPACGSGSFLIGAYQFLLDWHLHAYLGDGATKHKKELIQVTTDTWRLTTAERKRILLNNIYGVDIDPQAVEVTKLSLLLKVLEGETESARPYQAGFERILPDLGNNIKCGNSLIGPDFYDKAQTTFLDEEERYRVNVFDWQAEFPTIMHAGGFDAVIGNPPYVRPHNLEAQAKDYFWEHYSTFIKKSDLYCCFIERAVALLRDKGALGYIVSNGWLRLDSFERLREFLLDNTSPRTIIDFTGNVFPDATVKTVIILLNKGAKDDSVVEVTTSPVTERLSSLTLRRIHVAAFRSSYKSIFDLSLDDSLDKIKQKMGNKSVSLGDMFELSFGLKTGDDSKFLTYTPVTPEHRPLLRGEDVHRYAQAHKGEYVWYVPDVMREHRKTARPGVASRFEQPKVLIRDTGGGLQGTYDAENYYVKDVLVVSDGARNAAKLKFLIGLQNTHLMRFYYETSFPTLHVQRNELASLPIPSINFDDPADKARHDQMVKLVERMLDLHRQLAAARTPFDRKALERQIAATDTQIDQLVYDLYGLTAEERAIVEAASR
jgi:hypothetical protein